MTKKVLLLGGTGAIGMYLIPELISSRFSVYVTSRSKRESDHASLEYIHGDARDLEFLQDILTTDEYDVVVDFMNYSTEEFRDRYELLLGNCKQYIFLSSYRVFTEADVITEESPRILDVTTDQKYLETDEYALAKARQEDILRLAEAKNWTIVRPGITYSRTRFQLGTMEANLFVWRALQGLPVALPREMLSKMTTMTWAGDVGRLIARLALNKKAVGDDFNVVTCEYQTWEYVSEIYSSILGLKVQLIGTDAYISAMGGGLNHYQVNNDRMLNRILDNSKILKVTGENQSDFMKLRDGLQRELTQFIEDPVFGGVDYTLQARFDKLLNTRIDLSAASPEETRAYLEVRYPKKSRVKKAIRPRTRLSNVRQRTRGAIEKIHEYINNVIEDIRYRSEWQKYKRADGVTITLNGYFNYGNIIQRYALQHFLQQKGHDFISYEHSPTNVSWENPQRFIHTKRFVDNYIRRKRYDPRDKFPAYIVGSDQVWRNWGYIDEKKDLGYFFLDFVKHARARRIAYAVSIGKDNVDEATISPGFVQYAYPLVKKFHAIFMRESSGVDVVRDTWGVRSRQVVDPTMLLTAEDYDGLIRDSSDKLKPTKPIFTYILASDELKAGVVKKISSSLRKDEGGFYLDKLDVLPPVEQWLKGFRDAELVVTDSFHGMAFAIINNTPFVVIENAVGGVARITSLLEELGLEDRLITKKSADNFDITKITPIDWPQVNDRLGELRDISAFWLLSSLKNGTEFERDDLLNSISTMLRKVLLPAKKALVRVWAKLFRVINELLPSIIKRMILGVWRRIFVRPVIIENVAVEASKPLVSIISPYYNCASTIKSTVDSVLSQTFQNFEYIIIDDGSDLVDSKVLDTINHPKIRVVHLKHNIGSGSPAAARNLGILMSKGKYIVCLDSDDILEPTYIEKGALVLEARPWISLYSTNTRAFGEIEEDWDYAGYNPRELIRNNMLITAAMFRREAWEDAGGYKEGIGYEDWELWINMAEHGHFGFSIKDRLFRYRTALESRFIDDRRKHANNINKIHKLHPSYNRNIRKIIARQKRVSHIVDRKTALINMTDSHHYRKASQGKPNILIAVPWMTFGGAETLVTNFCNEVKDNFNLSFITGVDSKNEWEYKFIEITDRIYHLSNLYDNEELKLEFVSNYIETRNIVILHIVHTSFMFKMLTELKSRHPKLKVIVTVFNDRAHFHESVASNGLIDEYTTDNSAVQKRYQHELSKMNADNPVRVIPNGINSISIFNPGKHDRNSLRRELGIEDNDVAVFFVGRLSEEKNPDVFVEAAKQTAEAGPDIAVKFFVIGDGPMREEVESLIKAKSNKASIEYLGYQTDVAKYLSATDVFVLPSSVEGFPLSILEAMAMEAVVVASDVGAVADVVESGVDGFVVTPGSAKEIKDAILRLCNDRKLLKRMKLVSRKKVEAKYSNTILGKNYTKLYKDVVK